MNISYQALLNAALPVTFTAAFVFAARNIAHKFGVSSEVGGRRIERRPVPLVGGIAIFISTLLCCFLLGASADCLILLALSLPVFIIGILDDTIELTARKKLPIEIVCAFLWVFHLNSESLLLVQLGVPAFAAQLLMAFWIVGVTNAVNLSDGIDGLTAGLGITISAALIFASPASPFVPLWIAIIFGLVGFIPFNFSQRLKAYLGDSGSLWLGFVLACTASASRFCPNPITDLGVILSLFCYSEFDTLYAVVRRLKARVPIMLGDHHHIHHQLQQLGFDAWASSTLIAVINLMVALSFYFYSYHQRTFIPVSSSLMALLLFAVIVRSAATSRQQMAKVGEGLVAQAISARQHNVFSAKTRDDVHILSIDLPQMFSAIPVLNDVRVGEVASGLQNLAQEFGAEVRENELRIFCSNDDTQASVERVSSYLLGVFKMRRQEDANLTTFFTYVDYKKSTSQPTKAA